MFKYPSSIFDRGDALLGLLGSFWARTFSGRDQIGAFADGQGRIASQAYVDVLETFDCLARDTVPVFHREEWKVVYLLRSTATSVGMVPKFGDGSTYGGGVAFGLASGPTVHSAIVGVADVSLAYNRITSPTVSLTKGLDFILVDDAVGGVNMVFRDDPFADPRWATRPVYDANGAVVDTELAVWLFAPLSDEQFVYGHFGYVVGLKLQSSEGYKQLVGALLDSLVVGTSAATIDQALAALTGVPVVKEPNEVVEVVGRDDRGLLVATDLNAYRLPAGARPTVAVGDAVVAGQSLCDAYTVAELNRGTVPDAITSLAVGEGFLAAGYYSDLVFEDEDVPLVVATDPNGITRASFALSGFPADVDAFWDAVHANGVASGTTFANLLDVRGPAAPTQPTAASLPATINPLKFLAANFLRSNCFLVYVKAGAIAGGSPGLYPLRLLRRVVPPHTALIVVIEMPPAEDSVIMSSPAESLDSYVALEAIEESVTPPSEWDGPPSLKEIRRTCR